MQRQLELTPDIGLVEGLEIGPELCRGERSRPGSGLSNKAHGNGEGGIQGNNAVGHRILEHSFEQVTDLCG